LRNTEYSIVVCNIACKNYTGIENRYTRIGPRLLLPQANKEILFPRLLNSISVLSHFAQRRPVRLALAIFRRLNHPKQTYSRKLALPWQSGPCVVGIRNYHPTATAGVGEGISTELKRAMPEGMEWKEDPVGRFIAGLAGLLSIVSDIVNSTVFFQSIRLRFKGKH
jgi:hypothetical protein